MTDIEMRQRLATIMYLAAVACACTPDGRGVELANGKPGIGFDDLRYSPSLHRVLAPGGRSGSLFLVDPDTAEVTAVGGFSAAPSFDGGHDFGATSVDEARGFLFVTDRTSGKLDVVDPKTNAIVASTPLGASPDYVRYVAKTDELWVTEPSAARIEVFTLGKGAIPAPSSTATIPIDNGAESIVIDQSAGRAYTHRWQKASLVLDVTTRAVVAEWPNGCAASRGLAVDEARKLFFVACSEGTVAVLDARDGRVLSTLARGSGYDVIGYSPTLGHLYMAGSACACLVVAGVSAKGELSYLGRFDATSSTHCAVADDRGHAWVCDPDGGRLLRIDDPYPASF